MKQLLIHISLLILLAINPTAGLCQEDGVSTAPITNSASNLPFKIGCTVSRTIQNFTGITLITQLVAGQVTQQLLKKKLGGKVKVKIKTWSLTDLLAGKVRSVQVCLKDSAWKGAPIGELEINSNTPIWFGYGKHQKAGLKTPILLTFTSKVSEREAANALKSERIAGSIRALKLDLPGLGEQQLAVLEPEVVMAEDLMTIKGTLATAGGAPETGVPITIAGNVKLEGDDRIVLENMQVESESLIEPHKFAGFVEQLLNPLVNLKRFDRPNLAVRLNDLKISQGWVTAGGKLIIAPRLNPSVAINK